MVLPKARSVCTVALLALTLACGAPDPAQAPPQLRQRLAASLAAARQFEQSPWRDVSPVNSDDTLNGYVEIRSGESTKWEFRIPLNRLEVDRVIPAELGGYPTNYGFIPQTISYDGDPADVLVLGPPVKNTEIVTGRIIGIMRMMDDGDLDSKIVISPLDDRGLPRYKLHDSNREEIRRFFDSYKLHQGKVTQVSGWGDEAEARAFLDATRGFFTAGAR
jgi:inorganic pyrophosphatase